MRLLDTTTLELKDFLGGDVPPYAILSHVWSENEVTLDDLRSGRADKKDGFTKLRRFCALAKDHRLDYAWMDTCCIDKTSSAELSEAINSMYRWYQRSTVCYAYLEDVHDNDDPADEKSSFQQSRWFTRGWTLQELIAPSLIYFFSTNWKVLGSKPKKFQPSFSARRKRFEIPGVLDLCELLSTITGISLDVLDKPYMLRSCSAAKRMSWAAFRQTTRPEDIAYCLMGMFDINMPLLYGEGETKAFGRLQEEILKVTEDDTLLMHICPDSDCYHAYHPPLASSPQGFKGLGAIEKGEKGPLFRDRNTPSQVTPKGLQVQLPICPCEFETHSPELREGAYMAILDCIMPGSYLDRSVIVLRNLPNGTFGRLSNTVMSRLEFETQEVVLKFNRNGIEKATAIDVDNIRLKTIHISERTSHDIFYSFIFKDYMRFLFQKIEQPPGGNIVLLDEAQGDPKIRRFLSKQIKLYHLMDKTNSDTFVILLGAHKIERGYAGDQFVPYCKIFIKEPNHTLQEILDKELQEEMYPDEDPESTVGQDGRQQLPFSQPPSPRRATLELSGSKTAEVTVNSKRFLDREEHHFKLTIKENS